MPPKQASNLYAVVDFTTLIFRIVPTYESCASGINDGYWFLLPRTVEVDLVCHAKEFINWLKTEGYKFPVIAIVDNLHTDAVDVMRGGGAVDVVQRLALDKQLIETIEKYAKPEHVVLTLGNQLLPRKSEVWQKIEEKIQEFLECPLSYLSEKARRCLIDGV